MAEEDLDYAATNVSVDLASTDGTSPSTLGATDPYGFALSPRGQGAAKSGAYRHHRLVFDGQSVLAELELLS
ncbi:hypothetical protein [Streptomyces bobili]|uniref:hypothetical protein n=1 Tax=Streptomyces bobili TaxID=67280 RepID=UPI000A3BF62D|nr:hypothetical protein [Streptomyces bobili]